MPRVVGPVPPDRPHRRRSPAEIATSHGLSVPCSRFLAIDDEVVLASEAERGFRARSRRGRFPRNDEGVGRGVTATARDFLFHPLGSLPAEGPGSEGVRQPGQHRVHLFCGRLWLLLWRNFPLFDAIKEFHPSRKVRPSVQKFKRSAPATHFMSHPRTVHGSQVLCCRELTLVSRGSKMTDIQQGLFTHSIGCNLIRINLSPEP